MKYATNHSAAKVSDGADILFSNFTYADGFLGVGCHALHEDMNGAIWMGGDDRLTVFHPRSLEATMDTVAPNMQLASVQLFGEDVRWGDLLTKEESAFILSNGMRIRDVRFDSVSRWYGTPERLSLPYNNNYPTFNFIGITTKGAQKVRYQYMLEGMDQNWSTLTYRTEASYGNLPNGSYTFKVKAISGAGYWSKELQYPFSIRPPWWYSFWAYCLYIAIFGSTMWMLYRQQKASLIRKERESAQKRELEQAKEIVKAYDQLEEAHNNLKETQSQLIQSEKMASLGQLTAGIAHEIQNPLNFVNNFSEVNEELLMEMKDDLNNGKIEDAKALAGDAIENQRKIKHHGKRADAIVKSMLHHSRSSSGAKELTDINALCDEYLRLAFHGLRAKDNTFNAVIKTDYQQTLGKIEVRPQEIGRVILNLITNAFYAVAEKSKQHPELFQPTVSLRTCRTQSEMGKSLIYISVGDNGNGIPEAIRDKIFQPFFTTKPAGQGTGLGLSLSYDIVKVHGGELKVEVNDNGTEFVVVLPA